MPPSNAKTLAAKQTAKSGNPSPLNPTASLKPKAGPVSSAVARSNAKLTDSNQNIKASTTATMEPQQDQVLSLNAKNIADIKANIQAMEKAYKDSLALRRIQNAPVSIFNEFSNESGSPDMAGLLGIGVGSEDLLAKVTKDLISMKALKERNTQEKMKQAEERDALLSEAIQHTRSYYKAKQECMEAGPKLLYSFFNSFGNIVHIESLDSEAGQTYAVFSEPGVIEIIEYVAPQNEETPAKPSTAESESTSANPEAPASTKPVTPEASKDPSYKEPYFGKDARIRLLDLLQLDLIPPAAPEKTRGNSPRKTAAAANKESRMKSDMIKIQAMRAVVGGKGIVAPSIASVVKIFQTEKLVVPETKLTQPGKGGTQDRRVSILTQSPNVMDPLGRTSGTAQSTKIDSRTLEPELVVSHGFYVGTSLGEAIIIQIDVGASKNISLTINARRRTSILPIRTVCVAEFQNAVISVVSHTATDKYVAAHSLKLECIWQCKIEFLNGSVRDHLTRKINQAELENFNLQGIEGVTGNEQYLDKTGQPVEAESDHHVSALQLDDFIITSVCPDRFNKRILVALKSGNILTISAPFAVAETNSHRLIPIVPGARNNKETSIQLHTMPSMSEFGSKGNLGPTGRLMSPPKTAGIISAAGSTTNLTAIQPITGGVLSMADLTKSRIASAASRSDSARGMRKSFVQKSEEAVAEQLAASKDIFVSWLMDAYCVESFLDAIAKEKDENAKNDSDDPNLLFMQPNSPKPPVFIPISSISVFTNNTLQKDQLLITCPDGSVRVHTLDEGGSVTSVFPDLLQISDPESRTSLGTVCPSRVHRIDAVAAFCRSRQGCQLIASFSLDGTLSIMDVDENTVLLDMLIPSNRRIEKISAAGTALAATARLRAGSILGSLPSPRNRGLIAESTTDTAKHKAEKKTQKYGISVVNAEKGLYVIWAGRDWSVMTMKQLISWKLKNIARNRENSLILSTLESNEAENDVQSVPHFVIN